MAQKVNPISFRIQATNKWASHWFSEKSYVDNINEDIMLREFFRKLEKSFHIDSIGIDRILNKTFITVKTSKPGLFLKKAEGGVDILTEKLSKMTGKKVSIGVSEVKQPSRSAKLLAILISTQIEKRASYVRVVKKTLDDAMHAGVAGVKIMCSGRLSGAEIARSETYSRGTMPRHTIKCNIDYALVEAHTTYGVIGIKVWVFNK